MDSHEKSSSLEAKQAGIKAFVEKEGLGQVIAEVVKETVVEQPRALKTVVDPSQVAGFIEPGPPLFSMIAAKLSAKVINDETNTKPSAIDRALAAVNYCSLQNDTVVQDCAAMAFMHLAQAQDRDLDKTLDSLGVVSPVLDAFISKLCADLPACIAQALIPLLKSSEIDVYYASFNDFMCKLQPCLALKELCSALNECFTNADSDEDGYLTLPLAIATLERHNWVTELRQRRASSFPLHAPRQGAWTGSSQEVLSVLPPCPKLQSTQEHLINNAKQAFKDTLSKSGKLSVSRALFIQVAISELSVLRHFSRTWKETK